MKVHVALCLALVGCVADPPSFEVAEQFAGKIAPGYGDGCSGWECGTNSPIVELAEKLWDLPEQLNIPNSSGLRVTFFGTRHEQPGGLPIFTPYRYDVKNSVLSAYDTANVAVPWSTLGTMMWRIEDPSTGGAYELLIKGTSETPFWAPPQNATHWPNARTYYFLIREYVPDWRTLPTPELRKYGPEPSRVCGADPNGDGTTYYTNFVAVLFDDDWLDADALRVRGERTGYFNIGCAGSALWKQHLTGMTKAAANILGISPAPSINTRTANLKMLTSDVCGVGHSFTFKGQPLRWRTPHYSNVKSVLPYGEVQTLEARWDQNGAICLNTPRVDFRNYTNDPGATFFPDGVEPLLVTHTDAELAADPELDNWCTAENPRPPPCSGSHTLTPRGTLVTSVNYGAYINPIVWPTP